MTAPPHSSDAERSVLASCLLEPEAVDLVVDVVSADDWYDPRHGLIWEALLRIAAGARPIDSVTLREELVSRSQLERVGDGYLMGLTNAIPTAANVESHARIVREHAQVRRMIEACARAAQAGYTAPDASVYLDATEAAVYAAAQERHVAGTFEMIRDTIHRRFTELQRASSSGERLCGLRTGFAELDRLLAGLKPSELVIVAGRPGMGKTAFAINVADTVAATGKTVAVFSLEMSRAQLADRLICCDGHVDGSRLRTAEMCPDEWARVADAAARVAARPLVVDDTPAITIPSLRARCRRIRARHGLDLVVLDYLQLARSGIRADSREQEVAEVSRALKGLAKELNIPVLACAQLNRASETGRDHRPSISSLRESGQAEQDADVILLLYRDEVYNAESMDKGMAEVIIGKQRSGPTGVVRLAFDRAQTRFSDPSGCGDGYGD